MRHRFVGRKYSCPIKQKEYQKNYIRQHYLDNKQYYLDKNKKNSAISKKRAYNFVNRVKRKFGCKNCRTKNPIVLDFHHIRDKYKPVSILASDGSSIRMLKKEMRKCELLCANCHRIHHYESRKGYVAEGVF